MQIYTINAERKLASIASAIGRSPSSWQGWSVLQVNIINNTDEENVEECLLWIDSILKSYLQDVEGQAYFCHGHILHIVCKHISSQILEQAGQEITTLIQEEIHLYASSEIYELYKDGAMYASQVLQKHSNKQSIPVSKYDCRLSAFEIQKLTRASNEKQILNYQDYVRVLLVEDDPVTRWIVRNTVKHECQFATAPDASQAYAKFQAFQPDIVFLDIDLPDQSGREVLEWILRHDPGVCVVMFSSNDNLDNISETLEEGASGFIGKPFLKEDLMGYIRAHAH